MSEPEGFGTDLIREKDQAEIRELIAENANLRGYAQHISPCATVEGWTVCTCGLDDVLKEAAEPAGQPE